MIIKYLIIILISLVVYGFESYLGYKKHYLSSLILLFFVYFSVAGNYQNADTYASKVTYDSNTVVSTFQILGQWAYYLIINFCNFLHFDFIQYRFVVYGLGFIALTIATRRIVENCYPVIMLYILFPMVIDATQMKNFVAMCFITLAITSLIDETKKGKLFFILWIIVASGFHVVSIIYIPLCVLCDINIKKRTKYLTTVPIFLFVLLFSNRRMSAILSQFVLSNLSDGLRNRSRKYFLSSVNYGFWVYIVATIAIIFLLYKLKKRFLETAEYPEKTIRFAYIAFYCSIFSLVFFPLYFLRQDFSRLFRDLFPVFHLFIVTAMTNNNHSITKSRSFTIKINKSNAYFTLCYLCLLAYMFFWDIYTFKDTVIIPFFQYNSIFGT